MSSVIPLRSHAAAASPGIEGQQAIENALSMALYYVRSSSCKRLHAAQLQAATAKTNRALTLLKRACAADASGLEG